LYDIDVVISKTVVFAGLAGFITVVYVAIVVGVGSVVGAGGEPNLGLSVAATAVVAVAFGPVRQRVQRLANRLVYGVRATPYEVLSAFSSRLGDTVGSDELLGRMARLLAQGTGAQRARVWLRVGDTVRPAAAWPDDDDQPGPLALTGDTLPALPDADAVTPVVHHSDLLGALTVAKARGDTLTPTDSTLISDLAAQAGLVLRNVRLTAELYDRLDQLRASRQRLVAAQDNERRRLERDLHDGAQQQLVALKIKLGLARTMAEREHAAKTAAVVSGLAGDADDAITTLRDLARGIYPPLLAAEGLPAALTAQANKAPLPVTVTADRIARYPQDTEAAVYFSCLEALQNTAKYAHASRATITLTHTDGQLAFTISDDGAGFDPHTTPRGAGLTNITDRLHALGGTIHIHSTPGTGTTITGQLPVPARVHREEAIV
jgi:signal transduction histidine kinase